MKDQVYRVSHDINSKLYIQGPDNRGQCSYRGGSLNPDSRFNNATDAEKTRAFMEMAYHLGYKKAQYDIRRVLGIKITIEKD